MTSYEQERAQSSIGLMSIILLMLFCSVIFFILINKAAEMRARTVQKPLIGIVLNNIKGLSEDCPLQSYKHIVTEHGGIPVFISAESTIIEDYLHMLDGIIYEETEYNDQGSYSTQHDLIQKANSRDIPTLNISELSKIYVRQHEPDLQLLNQNSAVGISNPAFAETKVDQLNFDASHILAQTQKMQENTWQSEYSATEKSPLWQSFMNIALEHKLNKPKSM